MPVYEYTARNLKGDLVQDKIDLPSRDDVIAHLRKNRMVVVQVREAKGKGGGLADFFKPGVKTRDVVIFTRQFATMINSGLPLVQALDILSQQTENKVLADVTRAVVYDVESGHTLADALRKHPKAFSDLYVNMVAAGEGGDDLSGRDLLSRIHCHRRPAHFRHPDVPEHVRVREPGAAAAHTDRHR